MDTGGFTTGLFCAHRKLRTTCPECRPPPPPPKPEAERRSRARAAPAGRGGDVEGEGAGGAARRAKRVKPPTREEAEQAEAWWVRKP